MLLGILSTTKLLRPFNFIYVLANRNHALCFPFLFFSLSIFNHSNRQDRQPHKKRNKLICMAFIKILECYICTRNHVLCFPSSSFFPYPFLITPIDTRQYRQPHKKRNKLICMAFIKILECYIQFPGFCFIGIGSKLLYFVNFFFNKDTILISTL